MNRKKFWRSVMGLSLCAALLLSGCGGKGGKDESDLTSSPETPEEETNGEADYSKYNAYMDLYDSLSEMEEILIAYFMNVEYAEDFALAEGGDYGALKEAAEFFTGNTYIAERALEYAEEEPAYAKVDAAVRALGDSPAKMMDALDSLASYMRFNEFEQDSLARAPEIHAQLWEAFQVYNQYYGQMMDAMDELAAETRDDDLEGLLDDGQLILYHSRMMIHNSEDILENIWNQWEASLENSDPEAELVLPEIDRTEIAPLFAAFNTAYEELTAALGSQEEREKVFSGPVAEGATELYTTKVNTLYVRMGALADALNEGQDYSEAYDSASDALSSMIDGYNSII